MRSPSEFRHQAMAHMPETVHRLSLGCCLKRRRIRQREGLTLLDVPCLCGHERRIHRVTFSGRIRPIFWQKVNPVGSF